MPTEGLLVDAALTPDASGIGITSEPVPSPKQYSLACILVAYQPPTTARYARLLEPGTRRPADILNSTQSVPRPGNGPALWERQMTEFMVNDIVRVEMPRGYSNRGVLGISLMFSTMPEAKFEGAIGTITAINPVGPQSVPQYLVDFRTHDNSRVGIPWQAQWFREEWLALNERKSTPETPASRAESATSTWPTKPGDVADAASAGE